MGSTPPTYRPAIRALAAALACMPLLAHANFRCTDSSGRVYMVREAFGAAAGMQCSRVDLAARTGAAALALVPGAPPAAPPPAAAGPTRAGLLLLAAPTAAHGGGLLLARPLQAGVDKSPPEGIAALIDGAARRYGHEPTLLSAIVQVESGFNPNAVSPKGAIGLMQVMPATGARMGVPRPHITLFDPGANVEAGAKYLRLLLDMFPGRVEWAVAAYNAGEGAVMRHRGIPPFAETQDYVQKVMAQYQRRRGS